MYNSIKYIYHLGCHWFFPNHFPDVFASDRSIFQLICSLFTLKRGKIYLVFCFAWLCFVFLFTFRGFPNLPPMPSSMATWDQRHDKVHLLATELENSISRIIHLFSHRMEQSVKLIIIQNYRHFKDHFWL